MSDPNAGNSEPGPSNANQTPKAIGSLAKKPGDVTRLGTQKLKFVPTLPARRKKETEVKQEEHAPPTPSTSERGRGRGRGRGEGRGAGPSRGGAPRPPPVEMTASGPFAMGPALAGTSARRSAPRSNFAPIVPLGPSGGANIGAGLSKSAPPALKKEKGKDVQVDDDAEVYSDPDEGVEIIDMDNIKQMDWMAPESLKKEKEDTKKKKKEAQIKEDEARKIKDLQGKGVVKPEDVAEDAAAAVDVNLANAVDLSESEDEEELEDIIEDFALEAEADEETDMRQERLYFFQFPSPFPTFVSKAPETKSESAMDVDSPQKTEGTSEPNSKRVSFAEDTKPPALGSSSAPPEQTKLDGVIGQLEVYQSGAVKMRLGNGIVMDVTAATQPSFLQHAAHLDLASKRLCVLGEVNKRFVVSPSIDALLSDTGTGNSNADMKLDEELIAMDTES